MQGRYIAILPYMPGLPYMPISAMPAIGMECNGNGMNAREIQSDIAIYARIAIYANKCHACHWNECMVDIRKYDHRCQ